MYDAIDTGKLDRKVKLKTFADHRRKVQEVVKKNCGIHRYMVNSLATWLLVVRQQYMRSFTFRNYIDTLMSLGREIIYASWCLCNFKPFNEWEKGETLPCLGSRSKTDPCGDSWSDQLTRFNSKLAVSHQLQRVSTLFSRAAHSWLVLQALYGWLPIILW